ncbi:MAG: antitoxin [Propionibacteriaceae bacterium]|jgi:plasmid stability protein|nr:antitoxin [Propionibacteriaceae bacterium]
MATLTVRNLPDSTHRALKAQARAAGRSMEAEARLILNQATPSEPRPRLGSLLAQIGAETGGLELDDLRGAHASEPIELG